MAIVVKLPDSGEYLSELSTDENCSAWLTWRRGRKHAMRFRSRREAVCRIDEHLGRRVEIIRGDARFIRLVPKKRPAATSISSPDGRVTITAGDMSLGELVETLWTIPGLRVAFDAEADKRARAAAEPKAACFAPNEWEQAFWSMVRGNAKP